MKRFFYFVTFCILLIFPLLTYANDSLLFSNLFTFGDSLTDVGNISGAPFTNRNADGSASLWVNNLGNALGIGISNSNNGGNDYAQAGAVTGTLPFDPGSTAETVETQLQNYLNTVNGKADP